MSDTETKEMIARIDERTKMMIEQLKIMCETCNKHDNRLESLEQSRTQIVTIGSVVGLVWGAVVAILSAWISRVNK